MALFTPNIEFIVAESFNLKPNALSNPPKNIKFANSSFYAITLQYVESYNLKPNAISNPPKNIKFANTAFYAISLQNVESYNLKPNAILSSTRRIISNTYPSALTVANITTDSYNLVPYASLVNETKAVFPSNSVFAKTFIRTDSFGLSPFTASVFITKAPYTVTSVSLSNDSRPPVSFAWC